MHPTSAQDRHAGSGGADRFFADVSGGGPAKDLQRVHRQIKWSSLGLLYALGVFVLFSIVTTASFGPLTVAIAVAAVAGTLASGRLVKHQISAMISGSGAGDDRLDGPLGVSALAAVAAAIVFVAAAQFHPDMALRTPGPSWFSVPGMVSGAVLVAVVRRGWVVAGLGAGAGFTLLALAVRALSTGETPGALGSYAIEGAMVAGLALALRSEVHYWGVVLRLERARRTEAELAVAEERLRFAADLHDIQGHHLQVIALKSELAARLAGSRAPEAAEHMTEVGGHARAALADTRSVVQGYRRVSLGAELANATRVLASAGIDGRLSTGAEAVADRLGEPARHMLGLVAREATTNVLRHSNASHVRFVMQVDDGSASLEVRNDGLRPQTNDSPQPPSGVDDDDGFAASAQTSPSAGSGLAALADRVQAAGGTLTWERRQGWFAVAASLPAGDAGGR